MHQSSLTGKIVDCDNNYYSLHLNPSFVIDTMWEIPKAELRHGTEIAKGQCGVSIIEATLQICVHIHSSMQNIVNEWGTCLGARLRKGGQQPLHHYRLQSLYCCHCFQPP